MKKMMMKSKGMARGGRMKSKGMARGGKAMKSKGYAKGGAVGGKKKKGSKEAYHEPCIDPCCCQEKGLQARKGVVRWHVADYMPTLQPRNVASKLVAVKKCVSRGAKAHQHPATLGVRHKLQGRSDGTQSR